MSNLKNIMNKVLETVCVFIFAFITVVGTYQIVVRYVFNSPSTVSEELLTYSFTWLALLTAALVFGMKEHSQNLIGIDILLIRLMERKELSLI